MQLTKYICSTQLSAFDLVSKISDLGGEVCMVMNGDNPTRCVLSTYNCATKMEDFCYCGIITQWAEEWDVEYFNQRMKN